MNAEYVPRIGRVRTLVIGIAVLFVILLQGCCTTCNGPGRGPAGGTGAGAGIRRDVPQTDVPVRTAVATPDELDLSDGNVVSEVIVILDEYVPSGEVGVIMVELRAASNVLAGMIYNDSESPPQWILSLTQNVGGQRRSTYGLDVTAVAAGDVRLKAWNPNDQTNYVFEKSAAIRISN